jgi:hypothetical protein
VVDRRDCVVCGSPTINTSSVPTTNYLTTTTQSYTPSLKILQVYRIPGNLAPEAQVLAHLKVRTLRCPGLRTHDLADASLLVIKPTNHASENLPNKFSGTPSNRLQHYVSTPLGQSNKHSTIIKSCGKPRQRSFAVSLFNPFQELSSATACHRIYFSDHYFPGKEPPRNTFPDNPLGPETTTQVC